MALPSASSVIPSLSTLPESLLNEILNYAAFHERRKVCLTCSALWRLCPVLDNLLERIQINRSSDMLFLAKLPAPVEDNFPNVRYLDMGRHGPFMLMRSLTLSAFLPALTHLDFSNPCAEMGLSIPLCDNDLNRLCRRKEQNAVDLEYIDITYCEKTTYGGTFGLRRHYPGIVIRRQPEWMDGHFATPFENDGDHTYYADGSFEFEREAQSRGYVMELKKIGDDESHVQNKLQFINLAFEHAALPIEMRFSYRPGVTLLRLPPQQDFPPDERRQVLVAQARLGLRPPIDVPTLAQVDQVPLKTIRHFNDAGNLIDDNQSHSFMVSRMQVRPLKHLMPPDALVKDIFAFVDEMDDHIAAHLSNLENGIHEAMLANENDA